MVYDALKLIIIKHGSVHLQTNKYNNTNSSWNFYEHNKYPPHKEQYYIILHIKASGTDLYFIYIPSFYSNKYNIFRTISDENEMNVDVPDDAASSSPKFPLYTSIISMHI